jgi:hypothetical protein
MTQPDLSSFPLRRFLFVMKAIARDDLWDELEEFMDDHGQKEIVISVWPETHVFWK